MSASDRGGKRGTVGRADLMEALAESRREATTGEERLAIEDRIADLFGYVRRETPAREPAAVAHVSGPAEGAPAPPAFAARELQLVPFWRAERFELRLAGTSEPVPAVKPEWRNKPKQPPVFHVLSPWRELEGTLRTLIGAELPGTEIDTDAVVETLSRGRQLERLPMETRRRWGVHLQVVVDRSDRLVPFWQDQDLLTEALRRLVAGSRFDLALIHETLDEPRIFDAKAGPSPYRLPPAGAVVLVLGDLGSLDGGTECRAQWRAFGHRLASSGSRAAALLPCPLARCPGDLRRFWQVLPWERRSSPAAQDKTSLRQRAERLLRLVSPAVRIEPGFLRAVRRALGPDGGDAGTEADVWQHPALSSRSSVAATLRPDAAKELRAAFAEEPPEIRQIVLRLLRAWRHGVADEIWFEEALNLARASRDLLPKEDVQDARRFYAFASADPGALPGGAQAVKEYLIRVEPRATQAAWDTPELARAMHEERKDDPRFVLPALVDPINLPETKPVQSLQLWQRGGRLLSGSEDASAAGSLLGMVTSSNDPIQVEALTASEAFWASGRAPSWASDWGEDDYGLWASFSIRGRDGAPVIHRLRWISPGRFVMGSPQSEPGRDKDEGPQHEVTLSQGYWLFDTPCTQALWEAVMGNNPSGFKSPTRPVESVSFDDVQGFLSRLNDQVPGLELVLPSEAQWEYACRAGTGTATYAGEMQILGANNAPVLDAIAWYGGNSGVGFELDNGYDSSDWSEKQYEHARAGTRPVGTKAPNAWGLYDMLGNVWEWCADHWHDSYDGAPADGSAWLDSKNGAAYRVFRGGSWGDGARVVRAAYRIRYGPADRGSLLGFRCARVQVVSAAGGSAASAAPADGRQAERRPSPGPAHAAGQLGDTGWSLPRATRMVVRSNRDELHLECITKPGWADAMGRDRFGLYAEVSVRSTTGGDVTQRLRWIPPGRLWMGSPAEEEGRFDWEGPRHEAMIRHGYWLFDTPCIQALWEAVMGNNPSRFKSPTRPVESVTFDDVQEFLKRFGEQLRERDADLGTKAQWSLPSEAQWEYACRAAANAATYAGEMRILGENNAPVLDTIAWYGGNSGVGFELDNGYDSSDWSEKQYEHTRAGTRPVGTKAPNAWGLYDMLGNVWEWCADHWHESYDGAPADGSAWIDSGKGAAARVIRGGSWFGDARIVRAAYRFHYVPAYRGNDLGFRCARVQVVSPASASAERPGRGKPARRSPRAAETWLQSAVSRILPGGKRGRS